MDKPIHVFYQMPVLPHVAHIAPLRPFSWLKLGWEDLRHNPGPLRPCPLGAWLVGIDTRRAQ